MSSRILNSLISAEFEGGTSDGRAQLRSMPGQIRVLMLEDSEADAELIHDELRPPLGKLTPRQVEVLRMVAEGHRTREIAIRLNLSVKTIESHRGEIMKRLGIHDLVTLVRYAMRLGLVRLAA